MWRWRSSSLTFRLTGTLIVALALLLALTAVVQVGLQERCAREAARINGLAMSETLYGALHTAMLNNDREGLHASVRNHHRARPRRPGAHLQQGREDRLLLGTPGARDEGRYALRGVLQVPPADRPIEKLPPGDRTRSFTVGGKPAIGVIRPIENEPACSNASCHAHPASKRLLGVLDVTLFVAVSSRRGGRPTLLMLGATGGVLLLVVGVVLFVVRNSVHRPITP